jgi:hypothetical protein
MYLFTRRTRLAPGHGTAGADWARSVAGKARDLTGQELQVWESVFSPAAGTIGWSGWFESLVALEQFGDTLDADPAFEKLTNAGTRYTQGGFDDGLVEPSYGTPAPGPARYVGGAAAIAVGGSRARAMAAGVAIAQRCEAITGRPTIFCRSVTGRADAVKWFTSYESASAMEVAKRELSGDPSWLALLDSIQGCFDADAGITTTIFRRLG